MNSMTDPFERFARPVRWLRAVVFAAALCAPASAALAQATADGAESEPRTSPTESAAIADPSAESTPDGTPAPTWNRRHTPSGGVDGQLRRLAVDLGLDAGQQDRIRPILIAQREQVQRLQNESGLSLAERQRRSLALGDRSAEQIRAQLTDEQRAQYIKPRTSSVGTPTAPTPGRKPERIVKP